MIKTLSASLSLWAWSQSPQVQLITLDSPPSIGKTSAQQELYLGGFSGLVFLQKKGSELFFVTHTDRGPNPKKIDHQRPFALPDYAPELIFFSIKGQEWNISKRLPLKISKDKTVTGLPNRQDQEAPISLQKKPISYDPQGLDLEAIALDPKDGYWLGDEYGPSLVHFDKNGLLLKRLMPGKELPAHYGTGHPNRGFEGLAVQDGKVFGFLQSPLPTDGLNGRIVEVDLKSLQTTAEYLYPFESKNSDKIGDVWGLGKNQFLVLEQNGARGTKAFKKIFKITLNGNGKKVNKSLFLDLSKSALADFEKLEGLTQVDAQTLAIITDNDFGLRGAPDTKTGKITFKKEKSQLGLVNF